MRIEADVKEEESRQRQEAEMKKAQIEKAERNRREGPGEGAVDDSQLVEEMFDFIDQQTDSSGEGAAPAAFKVSEEESWVKWISYRS